MARALSVQLPESLSSAKVEEAINQGVEEILNKQGYSMRALDDTVRGNIIPVATRQAQKKVLNDGIIWNPENSFAHVSVESLDMDEETLEAAEEQGYLEDEQADKVYEQTVATINTAINSAAFFVAGGIIATLGTKPLPKRN